MRVRQLARVAAYGASAAAGGTRHTVRRRRDPGSWTRRDPHRIVRVAPLEVAATTAERLDESLRGCTVGGDWDLRAVPLRSLTLWRGLEQRIVEGRDWPETVLSRGPVDEGVPNAGTRLLTGDAEERERRLRRIDALIASLRRDGWLPHHDVGARFHHEMTVVVGRSGALVRNSGGLHRLIIAQLIGLERIPCRILAEHPDAPNP